MIEPGYSRYACDRAESAHEGGEKPIEYMTEEDKRAGEWAQVEYVDEHGAPMRLTLCPECAARYREIEAAHASEVSRFANEGYWR